VIQRTSETIQKFETEIELLIRLAYSQAPEELLKQFADQNFTEGVREAALHFTSSAVSKIKLIP